MASEVKCLSDLSAQTNISSSQVQYKRKPVRFSEKPEVQDEEAYIWIIEQTEEIFTNYEDYLHRMDFYKQPRFICDITGHSNLTFFEALDSERLNSFELEKAFPESLKEPVLRRAQFSTIPRIDKLVDETYEALKAEYYPGEVVSCLIDPNQDRVEGTVREKAKFMELWDGDLLVRPAHTTYYIQLRGSSTKDVNIDTKNISREKKNFTKQIIRAFLRNNLTREAWNGAPWLVKDDVAWRYRINTHVPAELRYQHKTAEKKAANQAQKKPESNGTTVTVASPKAQTKLPDLKPASIKSHKSKQQQLLGKAKQGGTVHLQNGSAPPTNGHVQPHHSQPAKGQQFIHFHTSAGPSTGLAPLAAKTLTIKPPAPPPPVIRYPIDDLDVEPKRDGAQRPALKYLSHETPLDTPRTKRDPNGLQLVSVGLLLETWDTLNVYCEVFKLDSFTFDDYVEALSYTSLQIESELVVEVHCAILKVLVDAESDGGDINITLPDQEEEEEEDEDDESAQPSTVPTPTPEPEESKPVGRRTRSSLAKSEIEDAKRSRSHSSEVVIHRAAAMLGDYSWTDRLRKRDFKDGGWEGIIVGLLYQLSSMPLHKEACETILAKLAPIDLEPNLDTAKSCYASLDVNTRAQILQIICMLTVGTKAIRNYMEECSEEMTVFRKQKIEFQRTRKATIEELRQLDDQRKILLPENSPPSPKPEVDTNGDTTMTGMEAESKSAISTGDDEMEIDEGEPTNGRSLRRATDRAADRKRKREEEREKKEKAEAAAKIPKLSSQFKKVLREIDKKKEKIKECEDEVAIIDGDLREADCPRTRCLGKDRFWNRYYWFERNGMPFAGMPQSSTAEAEYANGCLWVQGPDTMEREGFIEVSEHDHAVYRKQWKLTVPERKKLEEGPNGVFTAHQWGYIDEPEALAKLIAWLDIRGSRELKLRKEICLQEAQIIERMKKRKEYLAIRPKTETEEPSARVSTRKKQYTEPPVFRFSSWRNTTAVEELGHLHSEQPRARKPNKKSATATVEERETRSIKGKAKPLGRQGTRYKWG
ncbi:MAG: hypothetical protein M1814_002119 [Vezdaea aestivalis]|nr:MAG: hypothetical protein M1814_002119 [Vezdaea aestivalis]